MVTFISVPVLFDLYIDPICFYQANSLYLRYSDVLLVYVVSVVIGKLRDDMRRHTYDNESQPLGCLAYGKWCHNGHGGVLNHQPHDCLLNGLFRRRSKKTWKLRVTGLCAGNSPGTGQFPAQMASNAENVSIWWRHHVKHHMNRVKPVSVCFILVASKTTIQYHHSIKC